MPYFSSGPQIHAYLAEMRRRVFDPRPGSYLTVGEMPGVTPEQARGSPSRAHGQLTWSSSSSTSSSTRTVTSGRRARSPSATCGTRWPDGRLALADDGWNSLYWSNHDQPRVVSRFGNDADVLVRVRHRARDVLHLHRGTPYVYQGEELGMTNVPFDDISELPGHRVARLLRDRGRQAR